MATSRKHHPGVEAKHARRCPAFSSKAAKCSCTPSWRAVVGTGAERVSKTFKRYDDAVAWKLATASRPTNAGELRPGDTPTFRDFSLEVIEAMKSGVVRKRGGRTYAADTIHAYSLSLNNRILPAIGPLRIGAVERRHLVGLRDDLIKAGLAPSTIQNAFDPVRATFLAALDRGYVTKDPSRETLRLPTGIARTDPIRVASDAEATALIAALPSVAHRAFWTVAFYAALRLSEIRGLTWKAIDLDAERILVEQAMSTRTGVVGPTKQEKQVGPGKVRVVRDAGTRIVIVMPVLAAALRHLRASLPAEPHPDALVFERGFSVNNTKVTAYRAWKRAGLEPIATHHCRHTAISTWVDAGVPWHVIAAMVGHTTQQMTERYSHLLPDALNDTQRQVEAYFERVAAESRKRHAAPTTEDDQ